MDERTAEQLAAVLGGEAWKDSGGTYRVTVDRDRSGLVVVDGDTVSEYDDDEAFDAGRPSKVIELSIPEAEELYVIVDLKGNVIYLDPDMERGWRYQEDAEREAQALESRDEGRYSVAQQRDLSP